MTGRETEFIPNFPLFYTHKGRKKLFELIGVKTQKQFMAALHAMETGDGVPDELYEKIVYAGLVWLNKENFSLDDVPDLIETFYKMGKSSEDLETVIVDAYVNSGLYDRKIVETFRRKKQEQIDSVLKAIDESDGVEVNISTPMQVADMGEQGGIANVQKGKAKMKPTSTN